MKRLTDYILYIILLVGIVTFSCTSVWAKTSLIARFYSTANGLGSNNVRSVIQDNNGYIWLGTTMGLTRFDGYRTMLITPGEAPNRRLMYDHRIQDMRLLSNRYLLLRSRGDKSSCYDILTDCFVEYPSNGNSMFAAKPVTTPLPKNMPQGSTVKTDNRGNTIITTAQGEVWHINAKTHRTTRISHVYSEELLRRNGKARINVITDRDGCIWVSTYGNGIFVHDVKDGETTHYTTSSVSAPIQTDYLTGLYEDRSGNIWVSQENMGVACITKLQLETERVFFSQPEKNDHTNSIRLLTNVGGNTIYVGNIYNGTKLADGNLNFLQTQTNYSDDVLAVCRDKKGDVWIGTRQSGIYVGKQSFYTSANGKNKNNKVSDIICDRKGRVWISFFDGGVDMAESDGKEGYTFHHFFTDSKTVQHPRQLMEDSQGCIWLTTNEGLFVFQPDRLIADGRAFEHVLINKKAPHLDEIRCITEAGKHHVVAGTQGGGVIIIDNSVAHRPRLQRILTTADGLPDNNIQQLITDNNGNVWIGTERGLARYDSRKKDITTIPMAANSLGSMFIENAACRLNDGRLAFGTYHGILVINPHSMPKPSITFRPRITDIEINGISIQQQEDSVLFSRLGQAQELLLDYNQNSLTFYFSDFQYTEGHRPQYSYNLKGYDQQWTLLSGVHVNNYKNLPPGSYSMEIRDEQGTVVYTLPITVRSPLWATWWAYLIYICIAGIIAWYLWRNLKRTNDLRNRIKVENQLTEFKMRFFTNISHEFRTPLTIIRGAMERIANSKQMPSDMKRPIFSMQRSTDRMMRMISELMTFSSMYENKLRLSVEETDVVAFIRDIYRTFDDMAETKGIHYQFSTTCHQLMAYVDRSFIDKIVYNLISNSFKYTPANRDIMVKISQLEDKHEWQLVVEDTGRGIPKDKQKSLFTRFDQNVWSRNSVGIGLHLTGELVRVHHGVIVFQENVEGGCIFTITLPTDKESYADEEISKKQDASDSVSEAVDTNIPREYRELPPIPMNKRTVLIVEDDGDVLSYLQTELQQYFVTQTANNGKEALEKLAEGQPDLVLTDAMMPEMDGFELVRHIRANNQWAELPIIMLTALNSETDRMKGLSTGAEAYIQKPFSIVLLITTISKMIEQRDRLKLAYAKEVVGTVVTPAIITEESDRKLREQLDAWLQAHISDSQLTIDLCAEHFGYGRTNFFKKVKHLTGMTPNDYIRQLRMTAAAELLKDERLTVAEIAYKVGFDDQYYFSKAFKQYFGMPPTKYRKG